MSRLSLPNQLRQKQLYESWVKQRNIEGVYVHIKTASGSIDIPYAYIERQPPHMTNRRKWERWVQKIIRIAAVNSGWKLTKNGFEIFS